MMFKLVSLEDKPIIDKYLKYNTSRSCEQSFANVYLWKREYPMEYGILEDCLVYRTMDAVPSYCFPVGCGDKKNVIKALMEACEDRRLPFQMGGVTKEQFQQLEQWFPDTFQVEYNRGYADYIYETEKLQTLAGKKLHGKRNHVNRFLRTYDDWSYEPITEENLEECFQMALVWRNENGCEEDEEKNAEMCVTMNALRLYRELGLLGGVLRVNKQVVAFAIGEPVCSDTFVVHIEKALTDIEGVYPMINQQFAIHGAKGYQYINREDDLDEEGMRQAKLSYHPVFLEEKGFVTRKKDSGLANV